MFKILLSVLTLIFLLACSSAKEKKQYEPTAVLINKKVYLVGIHPYLNSKKMYTSYQPILDYLEDKLPNTKFVLETSSNYAAYNTNYIVEIFTFHFQTLFKHIMHSNTTTKLSPR